MSLVQFRPEAYADLAHLVERNLAKVEVAGPSPVIRLETAMKILSPLFLRREGPAGSGFRSAEESGLYDLEKDRAQDARSFNPSIFYTNHILYFFVCQIQF